MQFKGRNNHENVSFILGHDYTNHHLNDACIYRTDALAGLCGVLFEHSIGPNCANRALKAGSNS